MAEWVDLLDSENQKYDNTTSGLTATNAKDAIDELAASPGTGDVVGPAGGTVDDEFALYDDTTGKLIRGASGTTLSATVAAINGKIDGPGSATNREIVAFDGTTGKIADGAGYTQTQVITQNQSDQYLATGNKATPVSADRILIEDSAATYGKKYVDVGDLPSSGGIGDAPDDVSRTYFREGTTPSWTKSLKGYGEVTQATATSGSESFAVDDGNVLTSNLTGSYTLTALTASITMMSATWVLQHNSNAVSFPASFKFAGGTTPSGASGNTWILGLFTVDGGTNWIATYEEDYTL